jgi:hypothetical protein
MKHLLIVTAATALLGVPALATEATNAVEPKEAAPKARTICKSNDQIGSRLKKAKSCRTAREWSDLKQQTQDKTREIQQVGIKGQ